MFSIFIASTTASTSPALTSCPSDTATETSRPGIGDSRNFDMSGGAFTGISASSLAARGVSTFTCAWLPEWDRR